MMAGMLLKNAALLFVCDTLVFQQVCHGPCSVVMHGNVCRSSLRIAAANLPWVDIIPQEGLNVYSILQRDQLFVTTSALDRVIQQLSQPIKR